LVDLGLAPVLLLFGDFPCERSHGDAGICPGGIQLSDGVTLCGAASLAWAFPGEVGFVAFVVGNATVVEEGSSPCKVRDPSEFRACHPSDDTGACAESIEDMPLPMQNARKSRLCRKLVLVSNVM
jgi:hypothetical protein